MAEYTYNIPNERIDIETLKRYLWGAAECLRGQISAAAYKDYIFPLLFLKRISDVYDEEYAGYVAEDSRDYAEEMMQYSAIIMPHGAHWNDVFNTTEDLGQKLVDVFRQIENANPPKDLDGRLIGGLAGVFGDPSIWTNKNVMPDAVIRSLLNNFNRLTLNLTTCPADEMGTGYEYLVGQFADDAGHTAQEFYTNRTVVELMAEILQLQPEESIYDPTCGSGGMLVKCLDYLRAQGKEWRGVRAYGQELNAGTAAIAKMNLYLHGVYDFSIVNADTLEAPAFTRGGRVEQFDVVLANPPYSISAWNREKFANDKWGRNFLGVPPQDCADYAFIQHIIASMDEKNGRCAILLPLGLLSKVSELKMRTNLIESDLIECIIGLGPNLFFNSPMEAMIMVCNRNKNEKLRGKVLFINAVKEVVRKNAESRLEPQHIKKISNAYFGKTDIEDFCKVVDNETLLTNGSNLTISLYVMPKIEREAVLPLRQSLDAWTDASSKANSSLTSLQNML